MMLYLSRSIVIFLSRREVFVDQMSHKGQERRFGRLPTTFGLPDSRTSSWLVGMSQSANNERG
jgi:hypothetical protein